MHINTIAKAVFAGVIAGLGGLEVASVDNHFTASELIRAGIVALSGFVATYWVPNAVTSSSAAVDPAAQQGESLRVGAPTL